MVILLIFASLTKMPGSWNHTLKVFHLLIWIIFILSYILRCLDTSKNFLINKKVSIKPLWLKLAALSLDFRVLIIEWVGSSAYSELRGDRRCKIRNASRCSCHPLLPTVSRGSMWDSCGSNLAGAGRLVGDWEELTFASELTQCPTQWSSEFLLKFSPSWFPATSLCLVSLTHNWKLDLLMRIPKQLDM